MRSANVVVCRCQTWNTLRQKCAGPVILSANPGNSAEVHEAARHSNLVRGCSVQLQRFIVQTLSPIQIAASQCSVAQESHRESTLLQLVLIATQRETDLGKRLCRGIVA